MANKNRIRTSSGQFKVKRFDTKIGTIAEQYGIKIDARSDKKLGNYLRDKGYRSLSEMLRS